MTDTDIELRDEKAMAYYNRGEEILQRAKSLCITDNSQYVEACELEKNIAALIKAADAEYFDKIKEATHRAHRAACDMRNKALSPFTQALPLVKKVRVEYEDQKERERREAERIKQEEAARKAKEEAEAVASIVDDAGLTEVAEQVRSEVMIPTVVEQSDLPKVKGISTRKEWDFKLVDLKKVKKEYLVVSINEGAVKALVKAQGPAAEKMVGGIKVFEKSTGTTRTR